MTKIPFSMYNPAIMIQEENLTIDDVINASGYLNIPNWRANVTLFQDVPGLVRYMNQDHYQKPVFHMLIAGFCADHAANADYEFPFDPYGKPLVLQSVEYDDQPSHTIPFAQDPTHAIFMLSPFGAEELLTVLFIERAAPERVNFAQFVNLSGVPANLLEPIVLDDLDFALTSAGVSQIAISTFKTIYKALPKEENDPRY